MHKSKGFAKNMMFIAVYFIIIGSIFVNGKIAYGASPSAPPDLLSNIFIDGNLASSIADQLGVSTGSYVTQADLDKITFLSAINKSITDISGIGYLRKLEYLDLSNNLITSLPQEISNLGMLKMLTLSNNRIGVLPTNVFGAFVSMQKILLDGNKILDLTEIANLPSACIKNCISQTNGVDLGTIDTNKSYTQPVQLPQLFTSQSVSVSSSSNQAATITTDANGTKTVNVPIGAVGDNTVTARIESGIAAYSTYTITYHVINSYQLKIPVIDVSLNNSYTTSLRPTIYGTGIAGSSILVTVDGKDDSNLVTVNTLGNWSYTPSVNLTQGKHIFTAKAKDITNVWSSASTAVNITIDLTAPVKPVILTSLNNLYTNNTRLPISGTAEAGTYITLNIDSVDLVDCTKTDSTGKWSYTPGFDFSSGNHIIYAKARDAAGNNSAISSNVTIHVDLVAPQAPLIDVSFAGAMLNNSKPSFFGTGEIGSKITVYIDSVPATAAVLVDATGKWKYTVGTALLDGSHAVLAVAKDSAGNASSASSIYGFSIDTKAPAVPIILSPLNNLITNVAKPLVTGKSELNTTVVVLIDGKALSTKLTVDSLGNWSYTPTIALADGIRKITAKAYDAANNESASTTATSITIKTAPPTKPVIDTKLNNTVTNVKRPIISGISDAKVYITVNIDGTDKTDCTMSDALGKWSYIPDIDLADGKHVISARAKDIFSNVGSFSTNIYITIDTVVPYVPLIDASFNGALLNNLKPEIFGTAEAGVSIYVNVDATTSKKSVKADANGKWKFTPDTNLTEGSHLISAKAVDAAGNTSQNSTVYTVIINVTPPKPPTILQPGNNSATNSTTILFSGQSELYTKVGVYAGQTLIGTVDTDSTGKWSLNATNAIKDGKHSITAKATNRANNTSAASAAISITVDTTAPKAPVVTFPTDYTTTNSSKLTIIGTAEASSIITVKVDDQLFSDCVMADSTGKWTYVVINPIQTGTHKISASAKDGLGNVGPFGNPINLIIDQANPIVSINEIGSGNVTNDQQPNITGTVKSNSKVYLHIDDKEITTPVIADNDGAWKYKITGKLVEGSHSISGRAIDSAGNASTVITTVKFTVDLTPPPIPEIVSPAPGSNVFGNNPNPEISGKGETDSIIVILVDKKLQEDTAQVDGDGNWVIALANTLSDGKHVINVVAKDMAGNASKQSEPLNITVDTIAPAVPILISPVNGAVYKTSRILIQGKGEKGTRLLIFIDNIAQNIIASVDEKGNFSYTTMTALAAGKHVVSVALKDAAENASVTTSASISISSGGQTIKAKTPVISKPVNNSKTKDKRPNITGTASPNTSVTIKLAIGKSTTVLVVKSNKSGIWTAKPKISLKPGKYKITASAKDTKGKTMTGKAVTVTIVK